MATDAPIPMFPTAGVDGGGVRVNRFAGAFPDPYLDYASTQMPRSIYDVMRWCEYVWLTYGTYRTAVQNVVRYFLTTIELTEASDDEKEKYEDFLYNHLDIMNILARAGDNFMAYGNEFLSLHTPFRRYLQCPKCHLEQPISRVGWTFRDWKFSAKCSSPNCTYNGEFIRSDKRSLGQDKLKIIHWSPHEIRILYNPVVDRVTYLWEIPGWFKAEIRKGNAYYVESTPWEVIECIKADQLFRFNDDVIYHMREETIAGVRCFGWGIPRIMGNFKQAWYIQVLKRFNEAIALDYIIPFRVLTPKPGSSREADPLLNMNMGKFRSEALSMFRAHRRDPTTIHTMPFPCELQLLGADGKALAPTELLDKATDEFLNAQGVVAELYRGTLQWQAAPMAIRLFERQWVHMLSGMNSLINWIFKRVSQEQNWENLKGRLQPVTLADDMEKKQIQLQLAAGQQISNQTALAPFNINFREEIRKIMQEQEFREEEAAKQQEKMQQKQQLQQTMVQGAAGGMQPGMQPGQPGQPAPQGGQPAGDPNAQPMPMQASPSEMAMQATQGGNVTPDDLMSTAEQIAYQLLAMPYEMRKSEMLKIKKANETLHSLILGKMKDARSQARSIGGQQVMSQMVGGGAPM